jgi:hypothetical protein
LDREARKDLEVLEVMAAAAGDSKSNQAYKHDEAHIEALYDQKPWTKE